MFYYAEITVANIVGFFTVFISQYFLLLIIITPSLSYAAWGTLEEKTAELQALCEDIISHQRFQLTQWKLLTDESTDVSFSDQNETTVKFRFINKKEENNPVIIVQETKHTAALQPHGHNHYLFISIDGPQDTDTAQDFSQQIQKKKHYQVLPIQQTSPQETTFDLQKIFDRKVPEKIEVDCVIFQCNLWKISPESGRLQLNWSTETSNKNLTAILPSSLYVPFPWAEGIQLLCFIGEKPFNHPRIQPPCLLPCFTKTLDPNDHIEVRLRITDSEGAITQEATYVTPDPIPQTESAMTTQPVTLIAKIWAAVESGRPIFVDLALWDHIEKIRFLRNEDNTSIYRLLTTEELMTSFSKGRELLLKERGQTEGLFTLKYADREFYIKLKKELRPQYKKMTVQYKRIIDELDTFFESDSTELSNRFLMTGDRSISEIIIILLKKDNAPQQPISAPQKQFRKLTRQLSEKLPGQLTKTSNTGRKMPVSYVPQRLNLSAEKAHNTDPSFLTPTDSTQQIKEDREKEHQKEHQDESPSQSGSAESIKDNSPHTGTGLPLEPKFFFTPDTKDDIRHADSDSD